ncbi:MAG: hypothetical protein WBH92_07310, partial [Flavobacteriaceae bacterium]
MKKNPQNYLLVLFAMLSMVGCDKKPQIFTITYDKALGTEGFDGRLLILIGSDVDKEPRFQINDSDQ